jgi:hypothetical protein
MSVGKDDKMLRKRRDLHQDTKLWLDELLPSECSSGFAKSAASSFGI